VTALGHDRNKNRAKASAKFVAVRDPQWMMLPRADIDDAEQISLAMNMMADR
jgi:hypothetical protein